MRRSTIHIICQTIFNLGSLGKNQCSRCPSLAMDYERTSRISTQTAH